MAIAIKDLIAKGLLHNKLMGIILFFSSNGYSIGDKHITYPSPDGAFSDDRTLKFLIASIPGVLLFFISTG